MGFILKLVLIILLNKTYAYITQDSEIVLLPAWNPTGAKEISLTLKVFGKLMQLNLRRSDQIVSPAFEIWENNTKSITEKLSELKASDSCFYIHEDDVSSAAINICQKHGLRGLISVENNILEIRPLWNMFAPVSFIHDSCVKQQINQSFGTPHLVRRSLRHFAGSDFHHSHKIRSKRLVDQKRENVEEPKKPERYTIELAIFVDVEAYRKYALVKNIENIYNMMNVYVKRIQAFFHDPSLGVLIDISLVHLEIMQEEPPNFPTYSGHGRELLDSFCKFATTLNPPNDDDLGHWDIALYVSGIDFYERVYLRDFYSPQMKKHGTPRADYELSGLSYFDGACKSYLSCAIVEIFEHKASSYGITSSLNAVHQIGYLLGLRNESKQKDNLYVMSTDWPFGEIIWSPQSRNRIKNQLKRKSCLWDHTKPKNFDYDSYYWLIYAFNNSTCHDYLGREQTAKTQCELFLSDKDANVVTLHDICQNLQCETPHKNESYFARRALNGTYCALGSECCDGKCVPVTEPPYIFKYCEEDKWSDWKEDSRKKSCLEKSKGALVKRRFCEHQTRRTANCVGPYYDVVLCDDSSLCAKKRKKIDEFTAMKCIEFSKFAKDLNMSIELLMASGKQSFHNIEKPWIACTVFCQRKGTSDWYAPRQEMLDYGIDPYFPDGTWCHNKDGQNYYCRQHHCLPENYSFMESEECKNNC